MESFGSSVFGDGGGAGPGGQQSCPKEGSGVGGCFFGGGMNDTRRATFYDKSPPAQLGVLSLDVTPCKFQQIKSVRETRTASAVSSLPLLVAKHRHPSHCETSLRSFHWGGVLA